MSLLDKIINSVLLVVLAGSLVWFLVHEHEKFKVEPQNIPKEIITEPNKIDWAPLIPGVTSISLFFLRYFLLERKKKQSNPSSLNNHLVFDTIEDILENDLEHKNFGSEGRTEVMRLMISIQLNVYRDELKTFIENNKKFEDANDFRKKLRICIFRMVDKSQDKWRELNVPQILINKYSAMYKQRIDLLLSDVLAVSLTNVNPIDALNTFLNEARVVFKTGLQDDALMALKSLNGDLNNLTFNGKPL
jgi:hypothetical protein